VTRSVRLRALAAAAALSLALGCQREIESLPPPVPQVIGDAELARDLDVVRGARVFFAHREQGAEVLDAAAKIPRAGLRIVALDAGGEISLPDAALTHVTFAANDDPDAKIAAFERMLGEHVRPAPDAAVLGLDAADLRADTNTKVLFTHYREAIARLSRAHPETVFAHATVPLTPPQSGVTAFAKRLTGIADEIALANERRREYNGRVREAFRGEPIFDTALTPTGDPSARALIHSLADALRRRPARS
jgi:hypothetical protein